MSAVTRWWWVRHAPVVNGEGMIYGASDIECDVSETRHFESLARTLPGEAVLVTSHLTRTKKTARAITDAGLSFPEAIIEEDFGEQNFGDWQGMSWDQMMEADPETYKVYWSDPTRNRPPGGESFADLIARTRAVIDRLTAEHSGRDIVAVAHGGTIRAAMAVALKLQPEQGMAIRIDTLSTSVLENVEDGLLRGKGGVWRVVGVNRLAQE